MAPQQQRARNSDIPNVMNQTKTGKNNRNRPQKRFQRKKRQTRRQKMKARLPPGSDFVSKNEMWFDALPGVHKYEFRAGASGIAHLDRMALINEQFKIHKFVIHYRPSAGTNIPGNITYAIDYSPSNDRKSVDIGLLPDNASGTIFTRSSVVAKVRHIMKGRDTLTTVSGGSQDAVDLPFALYVNANTTAEHIGQFWVSYTISYFVPTSGSLTPSANAIQVCTSSSEISNTSIIANPSNLTLSQQGEEPKLTLDQGTSVVNINSTDQSSEIKTDIKISEDLSVGSEFTLGSAQTSAASAKRFLAFAPPKITFTYADGTPVPPGTFEAQQSPPNVQFSGPKQYRSVVATLFKLLLPLAKPVIASLLESLIPSSQSPNTVSQEDTILDEPPSNHIAFAFTGDSATITAPNPAQLPLASRLSTNLILYAARIASGTQEGYVYSFDANILSYSDSWVRAIKQAGGTGYAKTWEIDLGPDSAVTAFNKGDLLVIHMSLMGPLEGGFDSSSRCLNYFSLTDAQVKTITDFLIQTLRIDDVVSPNSLILESFQNNTSQQGAGKQNGLTMIFRINSDKPFKVIGITFKSGDIFEYMPVRTPIPSLPCPDVSELKNMGMALCEITILPTHTPIAQTPSVAEPTIYHRLEYSMPELTDYSTESDSD